MVNYYFNSADTDKSGFIEKGEINKFLTQIAKEKNTRKIRKIIADHHWILVTLLVCNAFACEAMPILLDKLVNPILSFNSI